MNYTTGFLIGFSITLISIILYDNNVRVRYLEHKAKLSYTCNHGVAVMTPEGNATIACAP